jgi:hypothetical protein
MSFTDKVDSLKVVERNINRIVSLEKSEAMKLGRVFKEATQRLEQQLILAEQGSFTQASLTLALQQSEVILSATEERARREVLESSDLVSEQSIEDLGKEIRVFSKRFEGINRQIPVDEIITALQSKNYLVNSYMASVKAYTAEQRATIERELQYAILSSEPRNTTIRRMVDAVGLQQWKILRITRTELHNIYNMTKNEGMINVRDSGLIPELKKTLIHPMDGRTGEDSKLAESLDLVVDIDKPFKYNFRGKERVFMNPPDRPNDRSIIVPYSKEWDN